MSSTADPNPPKGPQLSVEHWLDDQSRQNREVELEVPGKPLHRGNPVWKQGVFTIAGFPLDLRGSEPDDKYPIRDKHERVTYRIKLADGRPVILREVRP